MVYFIYMEIVNVHIMVLIGLKVEILVLVYQYK